MNRLTRKQSHHLEQLLREQRQACVEEAEGELKLLHEQSVADLAGEVADVGDESVAIMLTDFNNAMAQRHVDEIRAFDEALERIHEDRFGLCDDCGDEIAYQRLAAFPTATRCTTCQSMRERTFAHAARPSL